MMNKKQDLMKKMKLIKIRLICFMILRRKRKMDKWLKLQVKREKVYQMKGKLMFRGKRFKKWSLEKEKERSWKWKKIK